MSSGNPNDYREVRNTYDDSSITDKSQVVAHGIPVRTEDLDENLLRNTVQEATYATGVDTVDGDVLYEQDEVQSNPGLKRFRLHGYKDVWAAVLFLFLTLITLIWGIVNFATSDPKSKSESSDSGAVAALIVVFLLVIVVSIGGAILCLVLISKFPTQLIYIANIASILFCVVAAIISFVAGVIFSGVLMLIMAVLQAGWLYIVRDRIPFAAAMLGLAGDLVMTYPSIIMCNVALTIGYWVYFVFWGSMAAPTINKIDDDGNTDAGDALLLTVFVLVLFWAAQVIPNIMHVTTAGVVATWYFAGHALMPRNPTVASFRRATTTSFGSICFGSLVVAIIRTLRWLCYSNDSNDNEFLRCIMLCILNFLDSLIEYFNTYAFVHVAVYGCGYIEAAKRTWNLCKQCFFAAYFNDCLVGPTLMFLSIGASALVGIVTGLILDSVVVGAFAFVVALFVHSLFFTVVDSTVVTVFVCFAEQPDALQTASPDVYNALQDADSGRRERNEDDRRGGSGATTAATNNQGYHSL